MAHCRQHWAAGLSPRVRGNPDKAYAALADAGSIPACAGEPECSDGKSIQRAVYPRVCGGTPGAPSKRLPEAGLSPRVRGNRRSMGICQIRTGSIPACAGEPTTWTLTKHPK